LPPWEHKPSPEVIFHSHVNPVSEAHLSGESEIDTNNCMNLTTRKRLLQAATRLFADNGYRGASVRDICNLAGANPGAVSYHFGGKRQLYRSVLRRAADALADMGPASARDPDQHEPVGVLEALRRILDRMRSDDAATRLLLRDLADGGGVAVESLTPPLRNGFERIATALGDGDNPRASSEGRLLFLSLAAPLFLLTVAWPVVSRALEFETDHREALLTELVQRTLRAHGREDSFER
jgi:AcrR family transcriptional regulator